MPKNIGLYDDNLSVPRKKDIDTAYADTVHLSEQTLTDGQKQQARTNIGVKSDFVVNLTVKSSTSITSNKTPKEIYDAYTAGDNIICIATQNGGGSYFALLAIVSQGGTYIARFGGAGANVTNGDGIDAISILGIQDEYGTSWELRNASTYDNNLTIYASGEQVAHYSPGSNADVIADIPVPTKASDIGALPDTTDYVSYTEDSTVEDVTNINADLLQGHNAAYFATASDVSTLSSTVTNMGNSVNTLNTKVINNSNSIDGMQEDISILQNKVIEKMDINGGTMTGELIAQNNANYTTAQVRNIIISAANPSGGGNGDIWLKYTE